jgi:LacI family transcriptional regulator
LSLILPTPLFTELTQAIESAARAEAYSVILCDTNQEFSQEREYIQLMRNYRVDGLILAPTGRMDDYDPADMLGIRMPVVLVDRTLSWLPFDSVALNNVRAAMLVTQHILERGHRRIGLIGGPEHLSAARERKKATERRCNNMALATTTVSSATAVFARKMRLSRARRCCRGPTVPRRCSWPTTTC